MTETTAPAVRNRLALALDTDDLVDALRMAKEFEPWFGVAKVGLELFSATGPESVSALADRGWKVFLDLKLHDIPTTVHRAALVLGTLGATYLTLHAHGGVDMLRAGVEGLDEGAANAGLDSPVAIAVTVLTSDDTAPPHILGKRVATALDGGCRGIVCAASDVREAKQLAPRITAVVPGIRLAGSARHDQARAATPASAISSGADLLVIGRTVTGAADRQAAAAAVAEAVAGAWVDGRA
ncbi:MAG: orotidine-5'-phosphate decarboxylase [Acidimicrobiales bacterium]